MVVEPVVDKPKVVVEKSPPAPEKPKEKESSQLPSKVIVEEKPLVTAKEIVEPGKVAKPAAVD